MMSRAETHEGFGFSQRTMNHFEVCGISETEQGVLAGILDRASRENGYTDPKGFLYTLAPAELEVLRRAHSVADDLRVDALSFESAYDLLREPRSPQDGIRAANRAFPPGQAPGPVHRAWEEATSGMSPKRKAILAHVQFRAQEISANLKYDAAGNPIGVFQPGESGYRNIYAESGFSYQDLVRKMLARLEQQREFMVHGEYREQREVLEGFLAALQRNRAA